MNKLLAILVAGLIALACLSPTATAQKKTKKKPGQTAGDTFRQYRIKQGEPGVVPDPGETYTPGTAVPLDKRVPVKGLGKFVQPFVGTDPGRLAPGQSGELKIVLALKGVYVFEEGMHLVMRYRREQGQISFGNSHLLPAGIGKLKTVYQGLPVYDNTATIVIPVSIGGAAVYGQKTVGFEVEVDVTNGKTGIFHGRHTMDVRGKILVGPPLPVIQSNAVDESNTISAESMAVGADARELYNALPQPASAGRSGGAREALKTASEPMPNAGGAAESGADGPALDMQEGEGESNSRLIYAVPVILLLLILAMALAKGKGR